MGFYQKNIKKTMKTRQLLSSALLLCFLLSLQYTKAQQGAKLIMWYNKPASVWNEALPVGNGRIAAMIFGDPVNEKIQLNEGTFWSGGPSRNDNPDALAVLPAIRQLIFEGNYSEAETMINENITAKQLHGSKFQTIGNLKLSFQGHDSYTDYYRELDLEKAVFTATYMVGDVTYKREVFASQPDQVIVVRLTADQPGKITFSAGMDGPLQNAMNALDMNTLELTGLSSTHEGVNGQVKFDARVKIINSGGTTAIASNKIEVSSADEVVILISIATNFVDYNTLTANETEECINYLTAAETKSYTELLNGHVAAYQEYFNRVSFDLGTSSLSAFPTDIRIKNFSKTSDNELVAMYYQFGRYLLISSSQPGGQPATLQGLWNDQVSPPWDSKYTININTEMNYWPAEKCNLSEMHEPIVQMVKELSEAGQQTALTMYGCDGWVTHHNTDIWRICGVVDGAYWGMWPMGGAWLSQHLWEKYLYGGNVEYLDSVYPVLKSACEFYQDFLIEESENNWLMVSPSISPENAPAGHSTSVCAGTTMDNQILFDLFSKTIKAASLLKQDSALMVDFQDILGRLAPMQIGRFGQLQEWMEDWDNPDDQHRHVSHLYGLFPGSQISPYTSPELFDAARTSLIHRGDVSTGWSMGWKVNLWARLLDGNHALKLITDQLTLVDPVNSGNNGGTYPNLFDAHPPFQIDGNFGCTSGITEMLLQSHDGAIHFIPALPDDWQTGDVSGLRAYGGFDVSFNWEKGQVQKIIIKSNLGGNCRIRVPNEVALIDGTLLNPASGTNPNPFFAAAEIKDPVISDTSILNPVTLRPTLLYDMTTQAGETYTIICIKKPEFQYASVTDNNPKQIIIDISEAVKEQATFNGFAVKIDSLVADIDSVVLGDTANQLAVNLKDSISKENEVLLSYSSGNVLSIFDVNLENFTDTLVDNLLKGSSPRILELKSSEDGNSIIARFNKKMQVPVDVSSLTLFSEYNGTDSIPILQSAFFDNDSASLSFLLAGQVFADYGLSLSYSGNSIISSDSGQLKAFTNLQVTNYSKGLPFHILDGNIDPGGLFVVLEFSKPVAMAIEQSDYFTLTVNGNNVPIKDVFIVNTITIVPSKIFHFGDDVTVSYAPGSITATDQGILEAFSDFALTNLINEPAWIIIPAKIEAENFISQSGIQTEQTGDTGGGMNVGWIDDGDWMEYAIDNNTTDTSFTAAFRLASPSSGGILTVYLDEVNIGNVYAPNTGSWQVYKSVGTSLKIGMGKHFLKLRAAKGGFNINYVDIKKKVTSGINEVNSDKIKVYPNPVSGELCIESVDFQYNKVEITDIIGSVVLCRLIAYEPKIYLPVSLRDGMYVVKISNDKQFQLNKIVVDSN
jgi:alpha-L-fucosidase 2